jgi:hypothetical protein
MNVFTGLQDDILYLNWIFGQNGLFVCTKTYELTNLVLTFSSIFSGYLEDELLDLETEDLAGLKDLMLHCS